MLGESMMMLFAEETPTRFNSSKLRGLPGLREGQALPVPMGAAGAGVPAPGDGDDEADGEGRN